MVKTNGLDPRDPGYNDYGYSDFLSDYKPNDDQIAEWINDDTGTVLVAIAQYGEFSVENIEQAWVDAHEEEIEAEWDARGDTE